MGALTGRHAGVAKLLGRVRGRPCPEGGTRARFFTAGVACAPRHARPSRGAYSKCVIISTPWRWHCRCDGHATEAQGGARMAIAPATLDFDSFGKLMRPAVPA